MADTTNPFGDVTKLMEQFKMPGVDISALIEARRKDIEALTEANKAGFAAMQTLAEKQTQMFKEAIQGIQQQATGSGIVGGIGDPAKQAELVRKALEKAFADMKELAEFARQSQADAMAHITQRANEHMAEIKKLMQPK